MKLSAQEIRLDLEFTLNSSRIPLQSTSDKILTGDFEKYHIRMDQRPYFIYLWYFSIWNFIREADGCGIVQKLLTKAAIFAY